jgi:TolA-binding protein
MEPCPERWPSSANYAVLEEATVRHLLLSSIVAILCVTPAHAQVKKPKDTPAAAKAREKLATKINVDFKETRLEEIAEEIKKQVEDLSIWIDTASGVSKNQTLSYQAEDKPLEEVLRAMFKKADLHHTIGTKADKRYEGWLIIRKGKYPKEGGDAEEKTEDNADTEKTTKTKPKPKPDKTKPKEGDDTEEKPEAKPEDKGDKDEQDAARKLKLAKMLERDGLKDGAKKRYKEIIKKYPDTKAAKEAKELLDKLSQ